MGGFVIIGMSDRLGRITKHCKSNGLVFPGHGYC